MQGNPQETRAPKTGNPSRSQRRKAKAGQEGGPCATLAASTKPDKMKKIATAKSGLKKNTKPVLASR